MKSIRLFGLALLAATLLIVSIFTFHYFTPECGIYLDQLRDQYARIPERKVGGVEQPRLRIEIGIKETIDLFESVVSIEGAGVVADGSLDEIPQPSGLSAWIEQSDGTKVLPYATDEHGPRFWGVLPRLFVRLLVPVAGAHADIPLAFTLVRIQKCFLRRS